VDKPWSYGAVCLCIVRAFSARCNEEGHSNASMNMRCKVRKSKLIKYFSEKEINKMENSMI
jgi:hypothetical protein